jgi:hypothetical protein
MIKSEEYILWEIFDAPIQKTDRAGGLGSTGISVFAIEDVQKPIEQPLKRGRGRPKKVA